MTTLPKEHRAAVKQGQGAKSTAQIQNVPTPSLPGPGQILIKIKWTGLCGTDKSFLRDEWSAFGSVLPGACHGILGHEGAGEVVAVHSDVQHRWNVGDRAGIKWVASICGECEFCLNGVDEPQCKAQVNSGRTTPGTFQEYVLTSGKYATRIPDAVGYAEAAPILCGGVTAYVGCKRSNVRPGQWLALPGAGGGLGHLGVQYAKAMGMRVIAIDGGEEKGKLCRDLGAEVFLDYTETQDLVEKVKKITGGGAHGVVVTAATKAGYATAPLFLRPGGTMVAVGIPHAPGVIAGAPPIILTMRRLTVTGSVTGTLKDTDEALDFVARGLVHPILTKGTLEDIDRFCDMMGEGKLPGRAVLKVAD